MISLEKDKIYLKHISDAIGDIERSVKGRSKKDFKENKDVKDASLRRIEIIGEATKNISTELRNKYNEIEWRKIAGTRDVVIHAYFSVDWDLIWEIIEKDLPILKNKISLILKELKWI